MRTICFALLALGALAVATAPQAEAAPVVQGIATMSPDVYVGFGYGGGCRPYGGGYYYPAPCTYPVAPVYYYPYYRPYYYARPYYYPSYGFSVGYWGGGYYGRPYYGGYRGYYGGGGHYHGGTRYYTGRRR